MKTFTGQKKLIAGSAIQLLLNYCQEIFFVKSCYIYKSAYIVRKQIEAFFLSFLCYLIFFLNIKISNQNKVYLNIKIKFTSEVNIRFTFSVTLGLVSFCTNVEFLAEFLTNTLAVLPRQTADNFFLCF
jgi:hypothetical protein